MNRPSVSPVLLITGLLIFCSCAMSRSVNQGEGYHVVEGQVKNSRGDRLAYSLLAYPQAQHCEKSPLLFVMHGTGQDGREMIKYWEAEARAHRFMVLAPTRETLYVNRPEFTDVFDVLLKKIRRYYPVDSNRIYLVGNSSGALYVRKLLDRKPEQWRGVVLVASPVAAGDRWIDGLSTGPGFPPVLYVHGGRDDQFDLSLIESDVKTFKQKGVDVELMSDPDAGHECRQEWDAKIFEWVEEKQLKADARSKIQDPRSKM